jgi:hypothetical protein
MIIKEFLKTHSENLLSVGKRSYFFHWFTYYQNLSILCGDQESNCSNNYIDQKVKSYEDMENPLNAERVRITAILNRI